MKSGHIVIATPSLNVETGRVASELQRIGWHTHPAPVVIGDPYVGEELSVSGSWSSFQWYVDGETISGATAATYTPTSADLGKEIAVLVGAASGGMAVALLNAPVEPAPLSLPAATSMFIRADDLVYQDDTALTPVSANGQSVGYIADRLSSGLYANRRNQQPWSADLTRTIAWGSARAALTTSMITADGTAGNHYATTIKSYGTAGQRRTHSVRVKAGSATHAHIAWTGTNAWVQLRLSDGVIVGSGVGSGTSLVTGVVAEGAGVYRLSLTLTPSAAGTVRIYPLAAENLTAAPSETSTASIEMLGFQTELGELTDYQATEGGWSDGHDFMAVSNKPTYVANAINGKGAIQFDAASTQRFFATRLSLTRNRGVLNIFSVVKHTANGATQRMVNIADRVVISQDVSNLPRLQAYLPDGANSTTIVADHGTVGEWCIREDVIDWENKTLSTYINGAEEAFSSVPFGSETSTASSDVEAVSFILGDNVTGMLAAMLGRAEEITEAEREGILTYLADLYGITERPFRIRGAWTWFNEQRAIQAGDLALVGTLTQTNGDVRVGAYGDWSHRPTMLHKGLQYDDHNNPAQLRRSLDGRILEAYSAHPGTNESFLRISTEPDSVAEFGPEYNFDAAFGFTEYTYHNLIELTAEGKIYDFLRTNDGTGRTHWFVTSEDGGESWSGPTRLLAGAGSSREYAKYISNGAGRIELFCTNGHPDEIADCSIYHGYYENGDWHDSAGNVLALPINPALHLTRIWDGSTAAGDSWLWDIQIDGLGNPVVAYMVFPTASDHRLHYAKWNGAAWVDNEVAATGGALFAGQPSYSGGACIDPEDVNQVFFAKQVGGVHQVHRGVTADGGATWAIEQITDLPYACFRPFVIADRAAEPRLAFVAGTYASFTNYSTYTTLMDSTAPAAVEPDVTAPTITSSDSPAVYDGIALNHTLVADETVTWSIVGGADQALFTVTDDVLSLPAQDFAAPADADGNNTYIVTMRATDDASNTTDQTITVTVEENVGGYETESVTLFSAMSSPPDDTRKGHIDDLITSLKTAGVWAKLDLLYVHAAHDAQAARLNWKAPATFLASENGTVTFTADRGYAGDGSTGYLNTTFNPATAGGVLVQNSQHMGVWIGTDVSGTSYDCGNGALAIDARNNATALVRGGSTTQDTASLGLVTAVGWTCVSRDNSADFQVQKNDGAPVTLTRASGAPSSANFLICARNSPATAFSTRRVQAMHCGSALTEVERDAFYTALAAYMTAVGAS